MASRRAISVTAVTAVTGTMHLQSGQVLAGKIEADVLLSGEALEADVHQGRTHGAGRIVTEEFSVPQMNAHRYLASGWIRKHTPIVPVDAAGTLFHRASRERIEP